MNPAPNSDPSSYMNLLRGLTGLYPAANSTNNGLIMINPLQMYNLLMETKPALVSCSSPSSSSSSCGSVNRNNLPTTVMMTPLIPEDTENRPASSGPVDRTKLFVGNLPANTPLPELLELFTPFGPINHQLCVVKDDNYAFVHFYSNKSAEDAVRAVNGAFFHGRYLRVEYSVSDGHLRKVIRRKHLNYTRIILTVIQIRYS